MIRCVREKDHCWGFSTFFEKTIIFDFSLRMQKLNVEKKNLFVCEISQSSTWERRKNVVIRCLRGRRVIFEDFQHFSKKRSCLNSHFACRSWMLKKKILLYAKFQKLRPERRGRRWWWDVWERESFSRERNEVVEHFISPLLSLILSFPHVELFEIPHTTGIFFSTFNLCMRNENSEMIVFSKNFENDEAPPSKMTLFLLTHLIIIRWFWCS
jgi:hypothetical protein